MGLGFRSLGFKGLGFKGLGFRSLGFRSLGFRSLGFKGLGRRVQRWVFSLRGEGGEGGEASVFLGFITSAPSAWLSSYVLVRV